MPTCTQTHLKLLYAFGTKNKARIRGKGGGGKEKASLPTIILELDNRGWLIKRTHGTWYQA